jgi:hypothetical protein
MFYPHIFFSENYEVKYTIYNIKYTVH